MLWTQQLPFEKKYLHLPTNRRPWHRLVSDLRKKLWPTAISITSENFVEFEGKLRKKLIAKGAGTVHCVLLTYS